MNNLYLGLLAVAAFALWLMLKQANNRCVYWKKCANYEASSNRCNNRTIATDMDYMLRCYEEK